MRNLSSLRIVLPLVVAVVATGCHGSSGPCDNCDDAILFQFEPAIQAIQEVDMIVVGDDANYTGTYSRSRETGPVNLYAEGDLDDAGVWHLRVSGEVFFIQSGSLSETPAVFTYTVTADSKVVGSGTITPQYQSIAYCGQVCKKSQFTIPVTQ